MRTTDEYGAHPCKGCGRTTVSHDDYCAMCHNGYVRPQDIGHIHWHQGVLVHINRSETKND